MPAAGSLQSIQMAMDELLPHCINVVRSIDGEGVLYPQEQELIETVGAKRYAEFVCGRLAAKQALSALGIENFPVLRGDKGEPIWPEGVAGSITHTGDVCVVSVTNKLTSIGIDIEKKRSLKTDIERMICTEEELNFLSSGGGEDKNTALLIVFTAKESVYKTLYPSVRRFIGFKEAQLVLGDDKVFEAQVEDAPSCKGRYEVLDDYVLAVSQLSIA